MASANGTPALDPDLVRDALSGDASRFALDLRAECESTNAVLLDAPLMPDGRIAVVVCERQTAGRGRRGRRWLAWPGASLTFSAQWPFDADAPAPAGLSLVAGLAVATVLEQFGVAGVELKWPNDVQVHGRKLGGILVELAGARPMVAVVGIGLNLSFPPGETVPGRDDVTANTHLKKATGDPEAAPACFVANIKVAEFEILFLGDPSHRPLQGMLGGGDGSVMPGLCIAIRFEDGDDSFCFMDV